MLNGNHACCQKMDIITLLVAYIILFIRCTPAAYPFQNMLSNTQCKDPSELERTVKTNDKKSVSIDFYDMETAFMLKRVLDRFCNEKDVRFTVYGSNMYHFDLKIDCDEFDMMKRVCKGLFRICTRVAPVPFESDIMKPCSMFE